MTGLNTLLVYEMQDFSGRIVRLRQSNHLEERCSEILRLSGVLIPERWGWGVQEMSWLGVLDHQRRTLCSFCCGFG